VRAIGLVKRIRVATAERQEQPMKHTKDGSSVLNTKERPIISLRGLLIETVLLEMALIGKLRKEIFK